MESVHDLLDYIETGRSANWLAEIEQRIGCERLRVVVIKVLCWLKSQIRLRAKRGLDVNTAYPWCADLLGWLAPDVHLASIFTVSERIFNFREDVSEAVRNSIRDQVDKGHKPPLITMR
jgi:hypothetical protein